MNQGKKIVKIIIVSIFSLFIVGYALFRSSDLIFGVKIENVNIVDGSKVTENVLNVNGNAKNATNLTLNGREISIDKDGNFNETIVLLAGYNIISIEARDKFNNTDKKDYKIIMQALESLPNGLVETTPLENPESTTRGPEAKTLAP